MVRGTTWFKCPCCGKVFLAPDIELCATAHTMPIACPDCGSESPKAGVLDLLRLAVKR